VTRSLNKPDDYLPDKNFHRHLANGTIGTDWMFVYELAINKAIKAWGLNGD
jgi:hexosaminidase